MSRSDITAELAARLRRDGEIFRSDDLAAFMAGIPPSASEPDIDMLAGRFMEASRVYAVEIARRNDAGRFLTAGVMILSLGVFSVIAVVLGMIALDGALARQADPLFWIAAAACGGLTLTGVVVMTYGAACLGWANVRLALLFRDTARNGNPPAANADNAED